MAKFSIKEREDGYYLYRGNNIYAPATPEMQKAEAILEVDEENFKEYVDVKLLLDDKEVVVHVKYTGRKKQVVDQKKATSSIRQLIEKRKEEPTAKRQKNLLEQRRMTKPQRLKEWLAERRKETKSKFKA